MADIDTDSSSIPSYLSAADLHNLAYTRGGSWFDPSTWGEKLGNAGKLLATGMLSGANSFYNSGAVIGSWLGADTKQRDTGAWISSIDSDLGKYYDENAPAADLTGFIGTSFLPGIAGMKLFNAGATALKTASRTGLIGENLSRVLGLRIPETDALIAASAKQISSAGASFSTLNANTLAALAKGVGSNILEGAAFETAVQATMFKSPILDDQDGWDITKNIITGGLFGGAIGGAFAGAKTYGKIRAAAGLEEFELKPFSAWFKPAEKTSPSSAIILATEQKDFAAVPLPGQDVASKLHEDKIRRIDNYVREQYHEMSLDPEVANMVADMNHGVDHKTVSDTLFGADQIARVNTDTRVEKAIRENFRKGNLPDSSLQVSYFKLWGDDAGTAFNESPAVLSLADIYSGKDAINAAVNKYGFKVDKYWDIQKIKGKAHQEAEARYLWGSTLKADQIAGKAFDTHDLPVLERALELGITNLKLVDGTGKVLLDGFTSTAELRKYILAAKQEVAEGYIKRYSKQANDFTSDAVAKIANIRQSVIDGGVISPQAAEDAWFGWQSSQREYQSYLSSKGFNDLTHQSLDVRYLPSYGKVTRNLPDLSTVDGNVLDQMTYLKEQQKNYLFGLRRVAAAGLGNLFGQIAEIPDSILFNANRLGGGAKLATFANGTYGSPEMYFQQSGSVTNRAMKAGRESLGEALNGPLTKLGANQKAAIEWETINQKATRLGQLMVRYTHDDGTEWLVSKRAMKLGFDPESGLDFDSIWSVKGMENDTIRIHSPETIDAIDAHMGLTKKRTITKGNLNAAYGKSDTKDPDVFRPIRPSPTDYPYFAFVVDPTVNDVGHKTMIFAASEKKLGEMVDQIKSSYPKYKIVLKADTEDWHKAWGDYEYARTLHENYIDSDLANKGIYSEFLTKSDPQVIIDRVLQQHIRESDTLTRELVRAANAHAFDFMEDQAKAYMKVESSKFGTYSERLTAQKNNPYLSYLKTGLDISKANENTLLWNANKILDNAVSRGVGAIRDLFEQAKSPADLQKIDSYISEYGMSVGPRDAMIDLYANHTAPKAELSKFIRGANGILAKLTIGMDPLNALNNAIGANILRNTELNQILTAAAAGDQSIAGKLAIDLPGGVGQIRSAGRLIQKAIANYWDQKFGEAAPLLDFYKSNGWVTDITQQFKSITDDFALKGTESVGELNARMNTAFAKAKKLSQYGETFSGNKHSEEFNRFVSADVMRQLTDPAVAAGTMSRAEASAYISTFVNRVEGNIVASQRPLIFSGPIGQAIGLFQSYQFNLMQQMFRYISEGTAKDAAMLLGLQSTFYGLQGLPAFQFINQHVVGTLSGNQNHRDLYDAAYGVLGNQTADFLMYGLPSNFIQANIYSRGDINPRQLTVIPTTLPELPFIGAYGKFLGSVKDTLSRIGSGAPIWESMLQGLEHNGLSRPLAGLAQVLQATGPAGNVYSTSSQGSILWQNDLMSWASAVRLTGGRPLDEAIVNDAMFRNHAYSAYNHNKLTQLSAAIKAATIQGNNPSGDDVAHFARLYAETGGKQANFNKFMMNEIKNANVPESQRIMTQLQNPFAQKMQLIMGYSE